MKVACPKCSSPEARYTRTRTDLAIKCLCGFYRVVFSTLDEGAGEPSQKKAALKLPKEGTLLLMTLRLLHEQGTASTGELTADAQATNPNLDSSDVASYLALLRGKGLVITESSRRGRLGGSTWSVSPGAQELLK